ncbi:MAG: hypothetical protein JHD16_00850 [Solirubrobacteraceae bacterium]|nr:hypothetical protein [Solirubrobacteraceae bacterium]
MTPPKEQALAYATGSQIGVLRDGQTAVVGEIEPGRRVVEMNWAGDGLTLGWVEQDDEWHRHLTVADTKTGKSHSYSYPIDDRGHGFAGLAPGLHTLTGGSYGGTFTEYTSTGATRSYTVEVPPTELSIEQAEQDTTDDISPPGTSVAFAAPLFGQWLIGAESDSRAGAKGAPQRIFSYDPARATLTLAGVAGFSASALQRRDDTSALWVETSSGGACDSYYEIGGYGLRIPDLPKLRAKGDGYDNWEIRRAIPGDGRIDVIARVLHGGWTTDTPPRCRPDTRRLRWMTYSDGGWRDVEDGLVDLGLANDGRVARVYGQVRLDGEGQEDDVRPLGAAVSNPDGTVVKLPHDTRMVLFAPDAPMSLSDVSTGTTDLTEKLLFDDSGAGPLKFGSDPRALQAATSTHLRFDLDRGGCGTVTAQDPDLQPSLGTTGYLKDGRLAWLRVDAPRGTSDEGGESDAAVREAPGTATSRGTQVGDSVDALLENEGDPDRADVVDDDATRYVFTQGDLTLAALVDAAGTVRTLWWLPDGRASRCRDEGG